MRHRWFPNVLWQCPVPAMRRQIEAALRSSMPDATLYEAIDWSAAETLIEEHDMDIVILTLPLATNNAKGADQACLGKAEMADLTALRQLQPHSRFIGLSMHRLPAAQRDALAQLDISAVSMHHLAPTLLRPMTPAQRAGDARPGSGAGATPAAQSGDKGRAPPDG